MRHILLLSAWAVLAVGCGGDDSDTGGSTDDCSGDTGSYPNVLGRWTTNFAVDLFDETCNLANLDQGSEGWLSSAIEFTGYLPDGVEMTISSDPNVEWEGIVRSGPEIADRPSGGLVVVGERDSPHGRMFVTLAGSVYWDKYLAGGRDVWQGSVYIGLDTNDDGAIECDVRGDWKARKSGT